MEFVFRFESEIVVGKLCGGGGRGPWSSESVSTALRWRWEVSSSAEKSPSMLKGSVECQIQSTARGPERKAVVRHSVTSLESRDAERVAEKGRQLALVQR